MSSLSPSRYRPTPNVTGILPHAHERPWFLRPVLHYTRVALAAGLSAAVALAILAGFVHARTSRAVQTPRTEHAVTKRPLPEGMSSKNVVKWVPFRQSSGRTELAPWTSVDAALVHDPSVLRGLLAPAPRKPTAPETTSDPPGAPKPEAAALEAAKPIVPAAPPRPELAEGQSRSVPAQSQNPHSPDLP